MSILRTLRIALRALSKNKMRAGLTVLGVVIGIAAVTTMVSIGESASELVRGEFQGMGTNVLVVMPGPQRTGAVSRRSSSGLTAQDSDAIASECPTVVATTPLVGTSSQVIYRNNNWQPKQVLGVGTDYLTVRNWDLRHGGFFTDRDIASAAKVCIIGQTIVARLFQTANPLDKWIRIKSVPFRVIGVLDRKGANLVGEDQDNIILVPYSTVRKRLEGSNFNSVHAILASARSMHQMWQAEDEIDQLLYERHHLKFGEPPDFQVHNMTEIANVMGMITGTMTLLLSAIAGVSLVVGGVGIMNIMLVSVTERTREIGIRMAVGARPRDILRQFLVESVLLSCFGGLIGFVLGVVTSAGTTIVINSLTRGAQWPITISFYGALAAILFSSAVGIFFGYYPARCASRLDPIEALRYE